MGHAGFEKGTQFPDLFQSKEFSNSEDIAIIDVNDRKFTFQELHRLSDALAGVLRKNLGSHCTTKDIVIGICIPPSPELVISLFAIMKLGVAYLPFDKTFPKARILQMLTECDPQIILTYENDTVFQQLSQSKVLKVDLERLALENQSGIKSTTPIIQQETFIVMYTSGSSGTPKGVRIGRQALFNRILWQYKAFPFQSGDVCVLKTSLTFGDSIAEIFAPLLAGCPIVILPKCVSGNPQNLLASLERFKVTRIVLVPSLLRAILDVLEINQENKPKLVVKLWVCSGETLTSRLLFDFFNHFPSGVKICNFYGSTEVMADVTFSTFQSLEDANDKCSRDSVPIGHPIDNSQVFVMDYKLEPVRDGEIGQICIGGKCLALGYVKGNGDKFIFHEKLNCTLFQTGDYGYLKNDGQLWYCGRMDSQVKVRGCRVDLSEIQRTISALPDIRESVVLARNPGAVSADIVAFIKLREQSTPITVIESAIKQSLRDFEHPKLFVVEDIPLLINGKVDRQQLLRIYEEKQMNTDTSWEETISTMFAKEHHSTVKVVLSIISETLQLSVPRLVENIQNSFFSLGGNSLNCVTTVLNLKRAGINVDIGSFLRCKSILEVITQFSTMERVFQVGGETGLLVCPIEYHDFDAVARIVGESFSKRSLLEIAAKVSAQDTADYLKSFWNEVVNKKLSFLVRNSETREVVGCTINFDAYDRPNGTGCRGIAHIFEMIESLEVVERCRYPAKVGYILRSGYMATDSSLSGEENVEIIYYMEKQVLKIAKENNFSVSLTTNSSPLTFQIATELLHYKVLSTLDPREFQAKDGTRPFALMSDRVLLACCAKNIF